MDKTIRTLLITQTTLLYASLAYYAASALFLVNEAFSDTPLGGILFGLGLGCSLVALVISIILIVLGAKNIRRNQYGDMSFIVMIVKIALIPWFIGNFIICAMICAGMLNPFLFLFIPLFITYSVCITYLFIISTSLVNIGYLFAQKRAKTIKFNKNIIVAIVFHFIDCLDFIGAIVLYKELEHQHKEEIKDVQ